MSVDDLNLRLARALGKDVCGGEITTAGLCVGCYARYSPGRVTIVHNPPPAYDSNPAAALALVEELVRRGYRVEVDAEGEGYWVGLLGWYADLVEATAPTLPLAVARAALGALTGEEP